MRIFLSVLLYLLMTDYVVAQCTPTKGSPPSASRFNTGNNGNGGTIPGGNKDLNWTVAVDSILGPYQPTYVVNKIPTSYYRSSWPDCGWISYSADGKHTDSTDQFYKITFDLPCKDSCERSFDRPGTLCLNLDFYVDNTVEEIYVNGIPQSSRTSSFPVNNPYWYNGFGPGRMVTVSLCHDWKAGNNIMIVHIKSAYCCIGFLAQTAIKPLPFDSSLLNDTIHREICEGRIFSFGKRQLSKTGIYKETFKTRLGCDSIVVLRLRVMPSVVTSENDTICAGGNVKGHTLSGNYMDTFTSYKGCDSIHVLKLHVWDKDTIIVNKTICPGQSFQFGSQILTSPGNYYRTSTSSQGCIYIENLKLSIATPTFLYMNDTICEGGNSHGYSTSGTYIDTFKNRNSCDSIRTLKLYVRNKIVTNFFDTICTGSSFLGYTAKGIYHDTFKAFNGCDSIRILHLDLYPDMPGADFSFTNDTCTGKMMFVNKSVNYKKVLWELDKKSFVSSNINYNFTSKGNYLVRLVIKDSSEICADTSEKTITIDYSDNKIRIPNVFTPGNDSLNEYYIIEGLHPECGDKAEMQIYNRWGILVFEGDMSLTYWNGKVHNTGNELPTGTYYYIMKLKKGEMNDVLYNGVIHLIR